MVANNRNIVLALGAAAGLAGLVLLMGAKKAVTTAELTPQMAKELTTVLEAFEAKQESVATKKAVIDSQSEAIAAVIAESALAADPKLAEVEAQIGSTALAHELAVNQFSTDFSAAVAAAKAAAEASGEDPQAAAQAVLDASFERQRLARSLDLPVYNMSDLTLIVAAQGTSLEETIEGSVDYIHELETPEPTTA